MGGGDPAHERGIEAGRLGGRQLAARTMPGSVGPAASSPVMAADDAAPHVEHVGGALAQQRLVEPAVERGHLLGGVVPRALGGGAARDGLAGGLEQRLVVEQGDVGVEDRGLGVARAAGDRLAVARDRLARRGERLVEALALALGAVGGAVGRRAGGAAEAARGPDGDAGRGRDAREHVARPSAPATLGGRRRRDGRGAGAAAPDAIPSPKPSSASARSASSASEACGPDAVTTRVSPKRAPSATTLVRLVARTGGPPPSLATRTSAS